MNDLERAFINDFARQAQHNPTFCAKIAPSIHRGNRLHMVMDAASRIEALHAQGRAREASHEENRLAEIYAGVALESFGHTEHQSYFQSMAHSLRKNTPHGARTPQFQQLIRCFRP